jgi:hypothetical protein
MPQAAIRHYEDDEQMQNADVDQHAVSKVQAEDKRHNFQLKIKTEKFVHYRIIQEKNW